jgi:hypothetical protein
MLNLVDWSLVANPYLFIEGITFICHWMNPPYPNLCEHMWILEQAYMHMDEKIHLSIRFELIFGLLKN